MWQCPYGHSSETFAPRYILWLMANDHTGSSWMTAFNEAATQILNCDALHLLELRVQPPSPLQLSLSLLSLCSLSLSLCVCVCFPLNAQ